VGGCPCPCVCVSIGGGGKEEVVEASQARGRKSGRLAGRCRVGVGAGVRETGKARERKEDGQCARIINKRTKRAGRNEKSRCR
jgi:hypothetical protein